ARDRAALFPTRPPTSESDLLPGRAPAVREAERRDTEGQLAAVAGVPLLRPRPRPLHPRLRAVRRRRAAARREAEARQRRVGGTRSSRISGGAALPMITAPVVARLLR